MATGRVLQVDQGHGYRFVAADDGGEDVFLHASVLDGDPSGLLPGMKAEMLLHTAPALTGQQILEVRQVMTEFAGKRGWVDV